MSSDSPDYSGINAAAKETAKLSKEAFNWFKEEYTRTTPQREKTQDLSNKSAQASLDAQTKQNTIADEYNAYNKETFRPLEKKMVADAQGYDTPARQQQMADRAVADVNAQASMQREAAARDLASYGIAPDSGKSMSILQSGDINTSRAAAAAATGARDRVEATGYARMADAANLGRNLPSAQATAVQTANQSGSTAVGSSGAAMNANQAGVGIMQQGFNTAIQGQQASGNLYGQVASMQQKDGGLDLGGLGQLAQGGAALWARSDENMKSNKKKTSTKSALKQIEDTPVQDWRYDAAKGGPDDGKKPHTGPMAQDVKASMGAKVAPGGKVIDLISMSGKLMAGMQELSKRVKQLEGAMA